jgi:hypothetical protein
MAYLPKNKYKVLYTDGTEFKLLSDGKPYTGNYIKLNDGRVFAGDNPQDLKGKLGVLKVTRNKNIINRFTNNRIYSALQRQLSKKQDEYIPIPSSTPIPTLLDYGNGYFNRYISVRLNTKEFTEISKDTYENFNKRKYNRSLNKVFFIKWSLEENNEEKNTKRLRQLEFDIQGIFNFFSNKGEFGLRNGVILLNNSNRIYPNGQIIPKSLPAAYQLGNKHPNTIDNKNVPRHQHCKKCKFHNHTTGNCSKWNAIVESQYWCRAYKGKNASDMVTDPIPPTPQPQPPTPPTPTPTPPPTPPTNIPTPPPVYTPRGGSY